MTDLKRKRNIAIIVPTLTHSFEYTYSLGVRHALPRDKYNIFYITTGWVEEIATEPAFINRFHSELQFKDLDGIVIYGSAISGKYPPRSILSITNCYPNIPVINAGHVVDGIPSVIVDNKAPFKQFVHHLVHEKKCTEIAFIRGPSENFDANERHSGFLEAMAECSLEVPEALDWPGSFQVTSGSNGLRNFIQKYNRVPQAVICVNDITAIGVLNEAFEQGYSVPEDMMVIGFDDWEYALNVRVPLSTGRYPMYEMGVASGEALINWHNGIVPPDIIRVDSSVVYRKSTGDSGPLESSISTMLTSDRHFSPRYSNYERLLISRGISKSEDLHAAFNSIFVNGTGHGLNVLYFFQLSSDDRSGGINLIMEISCAGVKALPTDHILYESVDIEMLRSQISADNSLWVASPVSTSEACFGFIVMSVQLHDGDFCEFIANEIAKKIENIFQGKESANLMNQVLKNEKMASLGQMVSGIAHEINTPLGVSLLAASHLNDEIAIISNKASNNEMTKTSFDNFLLICQETCQVLISSLKRSADLVLSFKKVSVDHQIDELRTINLAEYIDDVLLSLKPKLRNIPVQVVTDLATDVRIKTHPGTWAQLINNLVLNAITHGFYKGTKSGSIIIELSKRSNHIVLVVKDNGKGIPEEILPLVFDPFFTTERGRGGTGLGLHIVYNMVTQKLKGTIEVISGVDEDSINGKYTAFTIRVPYVESIESD